MADRETELEQLCDETKHRHDTLRTAFAALERELRDDLKHMSSERAEERRYWADRIAAIFEALS